MLPTVTLIFLRLLGEGTRKPSMAGVLLLIAFRRSFLSVGVILKGDWAGRLRGDRSGIDLEEPGLGEVLAAGVLPSGTSEDPLEMRRSREISMTLLSALELLTVLVLLCFEDFLPPEREDFALPDRVLERGEDLEPPARGEDLGLLALERGWRAVALPPLL